MHILIADDTQIDRLILGEYVKKFGCTPIYAINGQDAVEQFKNFKPDLLILDVEMPLMNGYDAAKEIRLMIRSEEDWVPIIFLSSHVDDESIVKGIDSGGDDYLTKPVSPMVLKAKMDAMRRISMMHHKLIDVGTQLRTANQSLLATNMILSDLSLTDPLTGAANRRAFEECIEREARALLRRGATLALLMIDIDNFKKYNDNNGHLMGDMCLRLVSKTIKQELKRSSDMLARYGGEEFAVILPDTTLEGAKYVAEILRKAVESLRIEDRGRDIQGLVTISIGASCSEPGVAFMTNSLVNSADTALYQAKHQGKNRVVLSTLPLESPIDQFAHKGLNAQGG